jgi:hypothetical protein
MLVEMSKPRIILYYNTIKFRCQVIFLSIDSLNG